MAASADPSRWPAGRTVAAAVTEQLDSWIVTDDARHFNEKARNAFD